MEPRFRHRLFGSEEPNLLRDVSGFELGVGEVAFLVLSHDKRIAYDAPVVELDRTDLSREWSHG